MTQNQKFKASREITAQIDEAMAEKSQQLFDVYGKLLKNMCTMITESRTDFETLSSENTQTNTNTGNKI